VKKFYLLKYKKNLIDCKNLYELLGRILVKCVGRTQLICMKYTNKLQQINCRCFFIIKSEIVFICKYLIINRNSPDSTHTSTLSHCFSSKCVDNQKNNRSIKYISIKMRENGKKRTETYTLITPPSMRL
jgi:hypothetical protein